MSEFDAVVVDAAELVVGPDGRGRLDRRTDAALAVVDGRVAAVGSTEAVTREYPPANARQVVDAAGKTVVPGFVDAHTHALFAGDR
jgi:imidazolonepropionase